MEITSRAVAPIFCRPLTSCSTLAPSFNSTRRAGVSSALTVGWGTTVVSPFDSGLGCETVNSVVTSIDKLPCRMETAPKRTSLPMTTVPVRSLTTTRAWRRTSTGRFSTRASKAGSVGAAALAGLRSTRRLSIAKATARPNSRLMAAATSSAVLKLGSFSCREILSNLLRSSEVSRSTTPPAGIRPTVG